MFPTKKISGVVGGTIRTSHTYQGNAPAAISGARADPMMLKANTAGGGNASPAAYAGAGGGVNVRGFWNSQYQYMFTGLIPADPQMIDTSPLALFYRDIYLNDNTAGSAVDILSNFPFSDWELRGLEDHELKYFDDALERLNIRPMLPEISTAYLVDGFFCGSLVFDARSKQFMDILKHDALQCSVLPSPWGNIDPTINVRVGQATQQFIDDTSVYAKNYMAQMPPQFMEMLRQGAFTLDPITTLFVGRKTLIDRAYTSFLHRILPMYLIEKTLYRGMLVEASRRQRAMTLITAGDDVWTPNEAELNAIVNAFQNAEQDPLGGWVAMRNAIQTVDLRPGGDFWRFDDVSDRFVPYKLRAMGISESFLSGDASYAAAESAYSTFLETQDSYRFHLTDQIFYRKLFPLIATVNDLFIDKSRYRQGKPSIEQLLFDNTNRANMKMPKLHWNKKLEAKDEENMMDMLEKLEAIGVPIPLKMWMAAAGVDSDAILRDLKDDTELREKLASVTGKDTGHDREGQELAFGGGEDEEGGGTDTFARVLKATARDVVKQNYLTSAPMEFARKHGITGRVGIANRKFSGDDSLVFETNKSGSGKKHVFNQARAKKDMHLKIAKIAVAMDRDKDYRSSVKARVSTARGVRRMKPW